MQCTNQGIGINKDLRFLIVGGDDRSVELAKIMYADGCRITTLGMDKVQIDDIQNFISLEEAIQNCDIIIGPIPFSKEKDKVNTLYSKEAIEMDKLFECIKGEKVLLAGAMNKNSRDKAEQYKVKYTDYYWDESYQIMNAIPTAEGTIAILVNETDFTIHNSNILILGYGRIGKITSDYLKALGANVYVEARKEHDLAWISAKAMNAVPLEQLSACIPAMDVIINTIPAMILNKELLGLVSPDALIIDLASLPGGVDFKYAEEKGLKTIHALSLPGKVAHKTAAIYIYETLIRILANRKG